jgi:hypothetical protein
MEAGEIEGKMRGEKVAETAGDDGLVGREVGRGERGGIERRVFREVGNRPGAVVRVATAGEKLSDRQAGDDGDPEQGLRGKGDVIEKRG